MGQAAEAERSHGIEQGLALPPTAVMAAETMAAKSAGKSRDAPSHPAGVNQQRHRNIAGRVKKDWAFPAASQLLD